jgi:hypothetical protein
VDTDYLRAFGIGLQTVLHRARIKQHAGFPNLKSLLIRLHYVKATRAQKVEVTGSIRFMITRYSTESATVVDLCREGEVSED